MSEKIIAIVFRRKVYVISLFCLLIAGWLIGRQAFVSSAQTETEASPEAIRFSENFDGAPAPQLPPNWTVTSTGTSGFIVTTNIPDTAPNAVFTVSPATTSETSLTSPSVYVSSANTILTFRHKFAVENTWDGGVLEISVAGGAFQDIIVAGGSFITGAYNNDLNESTNPIGGRQAWTGATANGYITTIAQLPPNAFREFVRFRWRFGTNDSFGNEGWWIDSITMETISTGANATAITVPSSGTAAPYPSEIQISGMVGLLTGIIVDVGGFSHTAPDDVDILLVAPNGRSIVLMSDAGGNAAVSNLGITFDDSAPTSLPDNAPLTSDSFKPTNFEPGDAFPAPAPVNAPTTNTLSGLVGSPPNGTWRLYVVDDTGANAGNFAGGWSITLQSSMAACPFDISSTGQGFPAAGGGGSFQISIPTGCGWTATSSSNFINVTPNAGDGNGTINFTVAPNTGGARTASIVVSNSLVSRTFIIQQGSGCPTSVTPPVLNFLSSQSMAAVGIGAASNCIWSATTSANWILIQQKPQPGNGTIIVTASTNPNPLPRSAIINIGAQTVTVNQAGTAVSIIPRRFDFDGDQKADISVFRSGTWYLQRSAAGFAAVQFGLSTDRIAPADYDGDHKTDIAVFRDGNWYILQSSNNAFRAQQWGAANNDTPVPADYDGDGKADVAVWRAGAEASSPAYFFILRSASNTELVQQFGTTGTDRPLPADYDGDGKADLAVYREAGGVWYILQSSDNQLRAAQFGLGNFQDKPFPRDFDGDGKTDLAVFRTASGTWYLQQSTAGFTGVQFGIASDIPAAADYDGDGKADVAVYRGGTWYLLRSQQGFGAVQFGAAGDIPVPSFLP
jgi:subtilisin-like proprotein convertase family protein